MEGPKKLSLGVTSKKTEEKRRGEEKRKEEILFSFLREMVEEAKKVDPYFKLTEAFINSWIKKYPEEMGNPTNSQAFINRFDGGLTAIKKKLGLPKAKRSL